LVVSDTHDNLVNLGKFLKVVKALGEPIPLIHLGDVISPFTLRTLVEGLPRGSRVTVVLGNNDGDPLLLRTIVEDVAEQPIEVDICGLKAIALHGFKSPTLTERVVHGLACGGYYDVVLYGHTHRPVLTVVHSRYVLNPGALSGYLTDRATYAVVDCSKRTIEIRDLDSGEVLQALSLTA
jgi:putative phosphoesterase